MIRLLFLSAVAFAQPQWTPIESGYQYFQYGGGKAIEWSRPAAKLWPGQMEYQFMAPPAPARKVCAVENRPEVYWFTPQGKPLNHTFATPSPSVFHVSALQNGIFGFGISAAFQGSALRAGAVEVIYFSDRECSDGGVEFGFSRDLATDSVLVYWSTFANCGNDAASLCRKTDDGSLGKGFSNVQQEDGGPTADHGFRIYGLKLDRTYAYKMYVEDRGFRVEVWNGDNLASCSEAPEGKAGPCSFRKSAGPWFPLNQVRSGYIVSGTQTVGDPQVLPGTVFVVSDIVVAK